MKKSNCALGGFACAILIGAFAIGAEAIAQQDVEHGPREIIFHPPNPHQGGAPTTGTTASVNPKISFHGGPVITGVPHVYLIWYGNWAQSNNSDTPAGKQLVKDFLTGLSGSPYYQINATYAGVSPAFTMNGETTDAYSLGSSLTDANIQTIVRNGITGSFGTPDTNGVYLLLTSTDVTATSGFCTNYCGWHTHSTSMIGGSDIRYAFVGNANRCLNACAAQTISPNGNAGVDGMISVIAHELEEAHTDPNLNAWFDAKGYENADKCAWTFGSHQTRLPSGAYYNMTLQGSTGPLNFLVQRNLDVNSKCYIDYAQKWQ